MQLFVLIPNMLFILLSNGVITMKIAKYKQHFNSFGHSAAIVASRKNSCTFFSLLKIIPKDAEFHALSEYIFTSIITFVYSHNNLEKLSKKNKKYCCNEFDGYGNFIVLNIFFY
jgi:hypothetical protein